MMDLCSVVGGLQSALGEVEGVRLRAAEIQELPDDVFGSSCYVEELKGLPEVLAGLRVRMEHLDCLPKEVVSPLFRFSGRNSPPRGVRILVGQVEELRGKSA